MEVVAALGLGVVAEHLVEDATHAHSGRLPARHGPAAHRHQAATRRLLPVELKKIKKEYLQSDPSGCGGAPCCLMFDLLLLVAASNPGQDSSVIRQKCAMRALLHKPMVQFVLQGHTHLIPPSYHSVCSHS